MPVHGISFPTLLVKKKEGVVCGAWMAMRPLIVLQLAIVQRADGGSQASMQTHLQFAGLFELGQGHVQSLVVQGVMRCVEGAEHGLDGVHAFELERVSFGLQTPVGCLLRQLQFLPVVQLHSQGKVLASATPDAQAVMTACCCCSTMTECIRS